MTDASEPAHGLFGPGIFGTGIDLSALDDETAFRLGSFFGEAVKAAGEVGREQGRAEAWKTLPENVRALVVDAGMELARCAENDEDTERFLRVWNQQLHAVLTEGGGDYRPLQSSDEPDHQADQPRAYLLWDNERGMWWKADACGYTHSVVDAGLYTRDEAVGWALKGADGGLSHATVIVADGAA